MLYLIAFATKVSSAYLRVNPMQFWQDNTTGEARLLVVVVVVV